MQSFDDFSLGVKMIKKLTSVLDIGSSKLTVLTGAEGTNKNFIIYGKSDIDYSGFADGEFFEPDTLQEKIGKAIENVELATKFSIKELTVGVPSEFCYSTTKKINVTFATRKKLTKELIDEIYGSSLEHNDAYTPISIKPIYNILDNGKKLINVSNQKSTKITSFVNVIYARNEFVELFNKALAGLGILKVNYVCSALCEINYLLGELPTEAMIIDIGYLTTSVAVAKGAGLLNLFSFSQGGAHIMSDLAECLNITYKEAEDLKRSVILTLQPTTNDYYETSNVGKTRKIVTKIANEIVCDRLDTIAYTINACLEKCDIQDYMTIYLTGGGISQIKGAKDFLSEKIGQNIGLISPQIAEFSKPYHSSPISLLVCAIRQKNNCF